MSELNDTMPEKPTRGVLREIVRDAVIVTALSALVAVGVNALREEGIRWVQQEEYDILVPCPEPVGEPEVMKGDDARMSDGKSLLLDVRSKQEYDAWHVSGARSQPFDWLGPPVDEEVKTVAKQVAASRAQRVIVYGDGDDPDSGKEWAKLLSGANIKNVFYVEGGAPSLNPSLPKPEALPPLDDTTAPPIEALPDAQSADSEQNEKEAP
ncbi:MAG TPA: rhodanese-like domain-containing protein [Polyangiaceae bacterium]|nr:MAG: Rhodanese-like domain protein [Deltaproteobacteria bacterium ADurb.Bin207]HNZ21629.1 rhodanese-like domain-containing protein [Polyangiaceae bacterium]HOD25061.1 rhodanese-like domain-containing protein [Polyangiaceae bacterium]HOE48586.1 rhodanese-like domain-containing protein [Polyangiaceae bacterium]HOH02001.1 rhodanese-like domain-containing protein [Polyangiaceae bacterium]